MMQLVALIRAIVGDKLAKYALIICFVLFVFIVISSFFFLPCKNYIFGLSFGPGTECPGSTLPSKTKASASGEETIFAGFTNDEMQRQHDILAYYSFSNTGNIL